MPLDGHPQPVGAGPAGGSGASGTLLATDGATTAVLVVAPFDWRRITVVFNVEEGVEVDELDTVGGVEPVRPSKRIV